MTKLPTGDIGSRRGRTLLIYASYFTGGYTLHEYPDVPPYPASHGCVHVPAGDSIVVCYFATIGTPIVIA